MLGGKNILLGVTGGIAAYKSTYLVRLLIKAGAQVKVVLTPAARDFVTPLSLATLSKNPVLWNYYDPDDPAGEWHNHVELALWADLMIIAPATANTLSKMTRGSADNLLLGAYFSAKAPVAIAPAMDLDMYRHPANQKNLEILKERGHMIIEAESGELASGLEGKGRMAEPETIIESILTQWRARLPLAGKRVLVNGGPTYEAIDPVRYIGNRSSGRMGIALAESAARLGAEVSLVLGPTHLKPQDKNIELSRVETAAEMLEACQGIFSNCDLGIFSAAVADYRPARAAKQKLKKESGVPAIELQENPDILKTIGAEKRPGQITVGFALETENAERNARQKLDKKNCDLIVLNQPDQKGTGFEHATNEVLLISAEATPKKIDLNTKEIIADEILADIVERFYS